MYRLVVYTKYGCVRKHIYGDYDTLDYNATMCRFNLNIAKAFGYKLTWKGWKPLISIVNIY